MVGKQPRGQERPRFVRTPGPRRIREWARTLSGGHPAARPKEQLMSSSMTLTRWIIVAVLVVAWGVVTTSVGAQTGTATNYTVRTLPLPDNGTGDVSMDYIAFDRATNSLWVPGGNTGAVDVVDVLTGKVRQITNLPTSQVQSRGGTRVLGPTGVSVGDGVVYIGNRG